MPTCHSPNEMINIPLESQLVNGEPFSSKVFLNHSLSQSNSLHKNSIDLSFQIFLTGTKRNPKNFSEFPQSVWPLAYSCLKNAREKQSARQKNTYHHHQ